MPEEELRPLVLGNRREQLQQLVWLNESAVCQTAEVKLLDGIPFIEIIREVLLHQHDLIIKVAEGENVSGAPVRQYGFALDAKIPSAGLDPQTQL
jgi:hypothetical protein